MKFYKIILRNRYFLFNPSHLFLFCSQSLTDSRSSRNFVSQQKQRTRFPSNLINTSGWNIKSVSLLLTETVQTRLQKKKGERARVRFTTYDRHIFIGFVLVPSSPETGGIHLPSAMHFQKLEDIIEIIMEVLYINKITYF